MESLREKLYLQNISAEDLFDEIFTDSSLTKISKAFFRFKVEAIAVELSGDQQTTVSQDDIDLFFDLCDLVIITNQT